MLALDYKLPHWRRRRRRQSTASNAIAARHQARNNLPTKRFQKRFTRLQSGPILSRYARVLDVIMITSISGIELRDTRGRGELRFASVLRLDL